MCCFCLQSSGCQLACQFHREGTSQPVPVQVTQGQQVILRSGPLVTWPRPLQQGAPWVFVVMRQAADGRWKQLLQTLELSARVPGPRGLRVLVVGREGLVTIYSPQVPGLSAAEEVLRRVSKEALLALRLPSPSAKRINTQVFSEPSQNPLDMLVSASVSSLTHSLTHRLTLMVR